MMQTTLVLRYHTHLMKEVFRGCENLSTVTIIDRAVQYLFGYCKAAEFPSLVQAYIVANNGSVFTTFFIAYRLAASKKSLDEHVPWKLKCIYVTTRMGCRY